ncbi:MAG: AAC(3) family N-acetyltransferase [Eubacteriales bacterium]|jgi:aminoglycoside 3-N-acetyltransferase
MRTITRSDIHLTLSLLDVVPGDTILMHSALTAVGPIEGGADALIDAILEALGSDGTLVMSSLTGWSAPFDPDKTPSGVGYLSEVFRKRPGVLRSLHPVHSVIAFGKNAAYITADHDICETGCGEGSPYTKVRDLGGKIVLLGVDQDRNTSLHCLEVFTDAPYLVTLDIPAPVYSKAEKFTLTKFPPGHRNFKAAMSDMRRDGIIREAVLGRAVVRSMVMRELFDWGMKKLAADPFYFLCGNPSCDFCTKARADIRSADDDR